MTGQQAAEIFLLGFAVSSLVCTAFGVLRGLGFLSPLWFTAPGQQLRMMRAGFRWRRHRFERVVDDQVYEVWQMPEGWRACRIDYRYEFLCVGTWDGELYFPTPAAALVNAEVESWGE